MSEANDANDLRWQQHYQRWGIKTPAFDFAGMKNRVLQHLRAGLPSAYAQTQAIHDGYTALLGLSRRDVRRLGVYGAPEIDLNRASLLSNLEQAASLADWVSHAQALIWALEDCGAKGKVSATEAATTIHGLREALRLSPGAPVALAVTGDGVVLYPQGAKALDRAVVDDVLGFLGRHPKVAEKLAHALGTYLGMKPSQARNVLDDLRFCLEQLLRELLGNEKSLENQKNELGTWLDAKGVHVQVRNMYSTLLAQFALYQNNAVKHDEQWLPAEIEFMIYLTGTFMRMLLELEAA